MGHVAWAKRLGEGICGFRPQLINLFILQAVLLALSLLSLLFTPEGTPSYAVLKLNFLIIGPTVVVSGALIYACGDGS